MPAATFGGVGHDPERRAPHSLEAEQSTIAAVLLDNEVFALVSDALGPSDFYLARHRMIWAALERLLRAGTPADIITVFDVLRAAEQHEAAGGLAYLNELANSLPSGRHALAYAQMVRQYARLRELIAIAGDLIDEAHGVKADAQAVDGIIDRNALRLINLQQQAARMDPRHIADALPPWIDELNARAEGKVDAIGTGLTDVDRLMAGGMRRGEVIVIGARPSMGKSALMLTIARNVARSSPVLACSMEDSAHMLVSRQVAAVGRVNLADIRSPRTAAEGLWESVTAGVDGLRSLRLHIDDAPALTLKDVRRKALQVQRSERDLQLVIVDYLQLMEGEGETRAAELTAVARGLKRLAKELRCAVLLLSQLNREADKLDGPPRLDHLAESGGIEQAADVIALLWREARRRPTPENKHRAQLEFVKHKNGPTGTIDLWFDGATQRFEDCAADAAAYR